MRDVKDVKDGRRIEGTGRNVLHCSVFCLPVCMGRFCLLTHACSLCAHKFTHAHKAQTPTHPTKYTHKCLLSYYTEVKAKRDADLVVMDTDACIFTDEGFRWGDGYFLKNVALTCD